MSWAQQGDKKVQAVLCGDLGGTNSRLELHLIQSDPTTDDLQSIGDDPPYFKRTYKNDIVKGPDGFNVAGPVTLDRVAFTNLSWVIDGRSIEHEFLMPAESMRLVNDFAANGYGVITLSERDYEDISPHGKITPQQGAPVACIGAGTGLGETFATCSSRSLSGFYDAWPTEGGHVAFAPRDELQCELLMYLSRKYGGRVSTERVVSGKGIVNVYEFLARKFPAEVDEQLHTAILTETEGALYVASKAYDNKVCSRTMDVVLDAYGAVLGNAAVKWCPFGGLYIAGGIAIKNLEKIRGAETVFMRAYLDRGRVAPLLEKVSLRLVMVDDLGLRGAKYVALSILIHKREVAEKLHAEKLKLNPDLGPMPEDGYYGDEDDNIAAADGIVPGVASATHEDIEAMGTAMGAAMGTAATTALDQSALATSINNLGDIILKATAGLSITLALSAVLVSARRRR